MRRDHSKDMKSIENIRDAFLEHIVIYFKSGFAPKSLLRTFIDNWYAYEKASKGITCFLNKNGNPIWFNKPDPIKHKNALLEMDFISEGAKKLILSEDQTILINNKHHRLIKEHSIPVAILYKILRKEENLNVDQTELILQKYYKLGVLTKSEDDLLNSKGLRSKMPRECIYENVFARYDAIGIKNQKPFM
jgi:hypothetical protein